MFRIHLIMLVLALSVSGCANSPSPDISTAASRVGKLAPNKPLRRPQTARSEQAATRSAINVVTADDESLKREEVLRSLAPHSTAWWAVHDEIEAAKDKQLSQRLVICRGCFPVLAKDYATGSIKPAPESPMYIIRCT
jgi:hypothetical protein